MRSSIQVGSRVMRSSASSSCLLHGGGALTVLTSSQQRRTFLGGFFGGSSTPTTTSSSSSTAGDKAPKGGKSSWPFGGATTSGSSPPASGSPSSSSNAARAEQLVDASLALLDHARATDKYNEDEMRHIDNLLQIVFVSDNTPGGSSDAQTLGSLPQQFEAAAMAYITFHSCATHQDAAKIALVVMESFVPFEVGNMFQFVDWSVFTEEERGMLIAFTKAVLGGEDELGEAYALIIGDGGGGLSSSSPTPASIATLAHHLREVAVPKIDAYTSITKFLETSESIHLNAQLVVLLGRLMQVFDPEGTGIVALHEVEESLKRVTGEEEAERLLVGLRESAKVDRTPMDGGGTEEGGTPSHPYITYATLLRMIQTSSRPATNA